MNPPVLDPMSTQMIEALIGDLKRDFTILIVTHKWNKRSTAPITLRFSISAR